VPVRVLEHLRGGEDLPDQRLEVLEGLAVVVGVEGHLVPVVGELLGQREDLGVELGPVLLAGVGVTTELLTAANARFQIDAEDADVIAADFLADNGLG